MYEKNFPESTIETLKKKGYKAERTHEIGKTEYVQIDENGNIIAVADGRGDDSVAVQ